MLIVYYCAICSPYMHTQVAGKGGRRGRGRGTAPFSPLPLSALSAFRYRRRCMDEVNLFAPLQSSTTILPH